MWCDVLGDLVVVVCWRHSLLFFIFFFFNDTATTEIYTLSLHDALPIYAKLCIFNYKFFRHVYSSTAFSLPLVTTSFKSIILIIYVILNVIPKHSQPLNLTIVYRLPRSNKNTLPISVFFDEISDLFVANTITTNRLLITGDFNIYVDEPQKPDVCKFLQIIESFGLKQHVTVPTHVAGHTLDLVITRDDCDFLSNSPQAHFMITSHSTVLLKLNWTKPHRPAVTRSCRKIKEIDLNKVRSDLQSSILLQHPAENLHDLIFSTSPLCWQCLTTMRLLSQ